MWGCILIPALQELRILAKDQFYNWEFPIFKPFKLISFQFFVADARLILIPIPESFEEKEINFELWFIVEDKNKVQKHVQKMGSQNEVRTKEANFLKFQFMR